MRRNVNSSSDSTRRTLNAAQCHCERKQGAAHFSALGFLPLLHTLVEESTNPLCERADHGRNCLFSGGHFSLSQRERVGVRENRSPSPGHGESRKIGKADNMGALIIKVLWMSFLEGPGRGGFSINRRRPTGLQSDDSPSPQPSPAGRGRSSLAPLPQ